MDADTEDREKTLKVVKKKGGKGPTRGKGLVVCQRGGAACGGKESGKKKKPGTMQGMTSTIIPRRIECEREKRLPRGGGVL